MKQVIRKGGKTYCVTTVPYPPEVVQRTKKAGYQVKEVKR